jgi:alpha/beta fold family hydrolase-like protein
MIIEQRSLKVKQYTLRGLFSHPDKPFKNIVVMFHGFTGHKNENGYLFKQLTETLVENGYATLRYDFMGNGESDGQFTDYTFLTEIDDGIAIVKEAVALNGNKPIVLLGFSMGGAVASKVSLQMKDQIQKLILLSPAGNMPEIINSKFAMKKMNEDGNIDMGGYYMNVAIKNAFEGYDMYQGIETFEKPVLIMQGGADSSVPPMYSRKYHELYPNSEYIIVEGSEHCYTKVEYRKLVNQKVREFLN